MIEGQQRETLKAALQKFGLPTVAGVVGTGVGLILTRKASSGSGSDKGMGNLVDDLKGKLESVIGKSDGEGRGGRESTGQQTQQRSAKELEERRRAREQRRKQRRG